MKDITKKESAKMFVYNGREYEASKDVAFFSQELYLLKLENNLLGNFDDFGKYILPDEIFVNLSDIKKTIIKKENQQLFLKAECISKEFRFLVRFFEPSKSKKVAQLYVVEVLDSSLHKGKEIVSLISSYIDDNDAFFDKKYKKVFNIVPDDEEGKKEENEELLKILLERLKFEKTVYQSYLIQTRQKDKVYVEKLLKLLAADSSGIKALKRYEILLAKYGAGIKPGDKNYYRILKQLLDEAIEEEKKTFSANLNVLLMRLRQSYVKVSVPLIETLKTAVVVKTKEIEKAIKLGRGHGQPKFSYYKGVESKKSSSPKQKKKHPNLEAIRRQRQSTVSQEVKNNDDHLIQDLISAYINKSFTKEDRIKSGAKKSMTGVKETGNDSEKVKIGEIVQTNISGEEDRKHREGVISPEKLKDIPKEKSKAKTKINSESMFGKVFGDN